MDGKGSRKPSLNPEYYNEIMYFFLSITFERGEKMYTSVSVKYREKWQKREKEKERKEEKKKKKKWKRNEEKEEKDDEEGE